MSTSRVDAAGNYERQGKEFSQRVAVEVENRLVSRDMSAARAIHLAEKLATFSEPWQPRVVGQFNGHDLMVAKLQGEFVWHQHDDTDDFFLVLSGRLILQLPDGEVELGPGELFVVPRGVQHRPVAKEEVHVLLIERSGTPNTGDPATAAPRRVI